MKPERSNQIATDVLPAPRGSSWKEKSWTSFANPVLAPKLQVLAKRRVKVKARTRRESKYATPSPMVQVLVVVWNRVPFVYSSKRGPISVSPAFPRVTEIVTVRKGLESPMGADQLSPTVQPLRLGVGFKKMRKSREGGVRFLMTQQFLLGVTSKLGSAV